MMVNGNCLQTFVKLVSFSLEGVPTSVLVAVMHCHLGRGRLGDLTCSFWLVHPWAVGINLTTAYVIQRGGNIFSRIILFTGSGDPHAMMHWEAIP